FHPGRLNDLKWLFPPKTNNQFVAGEDACDENVLSRTEAEINIVPENRRVATMLGGRAGHNGRVWMPLNDFAVATQCEIVQGVGELAKAAADRGNQTALAEFAAEDIPGAPCRSAQLHPETKILSGGNQDPVKRFTRFAQVLYLAQLQRSFHRALDCP